MIRTIALALALCSSLISGAAAVAISQAVFGVVSAFVEAVTGGRSVRNDLARNLEAERARTASVTRDLDAERARSADLNGKLRTASTDRDRLRRELTSDVVVYRGEKKLVREAVADTSRRISSRVAGSALRNAGSAAGEALPFVGVGVIAAATAYELYEACEMIKEMHQLDVAFNPDHAIAEREVCGMRAPTSAELWESVTSGPAIVWGEVKTYYGDLPDPDGSGTFGWSYQNMLGKFDWMREGFETPSRNGPP